MQEITEQSVGFVIRAGKLTLRLIARAAAAYLRHRARKKHEKKIEKMNKQPEIAKKMKVKELVQSGHGVSTIELRDEGIRKFERLCKKNGVSYAIQADKTQRHRRTQYSLKPRMLMSLIAFRRIQRETQRRPQTGFI